MLIDGRIYGTSGKSPAHARVGGNIFAVLHAKLRGTGCRPFNSGMGVRVTDTDVRYPDVSVSCGNPATPEREQARVLTDLVVIVEVLSASTVRVDEGARLGQYRALPSVDAIVFVDPENATSRVI